MVQKIFDLHDKKKYRSETLFTAVNIMDRYLYSTGHWTFPRDDCQILAPTCLFLAAKMDEAKAPSYDGLLSVIDKREDIRVTRKSIGAMESDILIALGFDLSLPGPVVPIERFLHLLGINRVKILRLLTETMCKFSLNDPHFLQYRPSQIAACATILSTNIYHRDKDLFEKKTLSQSKSL